MIVLIDFGSQTAHLILRRIEELGSLVTIATPEQVFKVIDILSQDPRTKVEGIIFSGGPASVYEKNAPTIDKKIFEKGIPILGICYGEQLITFLLEGEVKPGSKKEYGPAVLTTLNLEQSELLRGLPEVSRVWMSHGDEVVQIPKEFKTFGVTETIPHAVIENKDKKIYGIQFHPEVIHTEFGENILGNFLKICGSKPGSRTIDEVYVKELENFVKVSIEDDKAICALSGGVDSSVAALIAYKAIGKNLTAVYVESGLMRKDETEILQSVFKKHYHMDIKIIDAKDEFIKALQGITNPEEKRKIIGKTFIEVFEKEARRTGAKFLVQGTIYPDVIESAGTKHAKLIKSHHNVGGLPKIMNLELIEPLRHLYKDQVRLIGGILGLPDFIIQRQPFPGPGLAVRIIGDVTEYKLNILRKADDIVRDEIQKANLTEKLWQAFAVFTGIKTTGVRGDNRAYGETIAIRAIEAKDAMSANFAHLSYEVLEKISVRIVTEIPEVNRVVYDITNKPPATMEWE